MKYKKIVALGLGVMALGSLAACTQKDPMMDPAVQAKIAEAQDAAYTKGLVSGKQLVDITADNEEVVAAALADKFTAEDVETKLAEQKALDEAVLADYKAELDATKLELASLVVKPVVNANSDSSFKKDDLALQSVVTESLDDSDLSFLQDKEIEFDDDDYDVHETIELTGIGVKTSIAENEFDDKVFMTIPENGIVYKYIFDDALDSTLIDHDEPLNINFLGKDLEIVEVTTTSFTTIEGEKLMLEEGHEQIVKVDGEDVKVKLLVVSDSSNKVSVEVNGVIKTSIAEGDVAEVGDYEVYVKSVMANEAGDATNDYAELRIAKDVEKTYDDGDEVIEDDERWKYKIVVNPDNTINYLGVEYSENSDDLDDDYPAVVEKEFVVLPNDFAKVGIELEEQSYETYKFDFAEHNDADFVRIQASDSEGIEIGTDKTDKAYVNSTHIVYDNDDGDEQVKALNTAFLVNDDTSLALSYSAPNLVIGTKLKLNVNSDFTQSGATAEEAEATDIIYDGVNYGLQEEDLMTETGLIIKNPEDSADDDKLEIEVPSDTVEAVLKVE